MSDSDISAGFSEKYFAPLKPEEKQFYVAKRKSKWVRSGPVLSEEEAEGLEEQSVRNLVRFFSLELRAGGNLKKLIPSGARRQLRSLGVIGRIGGIHVHLTPLGEELLGEIEKEV